ncbi:MAG: hypothetical protein ACM3X6_11875 [Patescibacteria group bacterium]
MRRFVVAEAPALAEAARFWPWLGILPGPWRAAAAVFTRPRLLPAFYNEGRSVAGQALALPRRHHTRLALPGRSRPERARAPLAGALAECGPVWGWAGPPPPPLLPGITWRPGSVFRLLLALSPFLREHGPFGRDPAVLVSGEPGLATASACRFLAARVRWLTLVCPGEHFRDRLAWQILCETGLAMLTRAEMAPGGWDVAIQIGEVPAVLAAGSGCARLPRAHFPSPLLHPKSGEEVPQNMDPVWCECHLDCLGSGAGESLPVDPTLGALTAALDLANRVGLSFSLA